VGHPDLAAKGLLLKRATLIIGLLALLTPGLLAACSGTADSDAVPLAVHTAPNGDRYNDADLEFLNDMTQHHAQAILMVAMTGTHPLSPAAQRVAEDIRSTNGPQVEEMVDWLQDWDEPVPETSMDHAHGDDVADSYSSLPGMATDEELSALETLAGSELDRRWLTLMVNHHEGAITLTEAELDLGVYGPARELATVIQRTQRQQLERITALESAK